MAKRNRNNNNLPVPYAAPVPAYQPVQLPGQYSYEPPYVMPAMPVRPQSQTQLMEQAVRDPYLYLDMALANPNAVVLDDEDDLYDYPRPTPLGWFVIVLLVMLMGIFLLGAVDRAQASNSSATSLNIQTQTVPAPPAPPASSSVPALATDTNGMDALLLTATQNCMAVNVKHSRVTILPIDMSPFVVDIAADTDAENIKGFYDCMSAAGWTLQPYSYAQQ